MSDAARHFDAVAPDYDRFKRKQAFYNDQLKGLVAGLAGDLSDKTALELGCGTGQILRSLQPRFGVGVDISPAMVTLAGRDSAPGLEFHQADIMDFIPDRAFDVVFCCDVLEHLPEYLPLLRRLKQYPGAARCILTWPNPRWFPAMRLGELLGIKTPEGSLYARRLQDVAAAAAECGLRVEQSGYRLLMPVDLPLVTGRLNAWHQQGLLRRWGLIQYLVLGR